MDETDGIAVVDVTTEIIGERREEWRAGFDAGIRAGTQRTLQSHALESIVFELTLLRAVAKKLGEKADYWSSRSDDLELQLEHWWKAAHGLEVA